MLETEDRRSDLWVTLAAGAESVWLWGAKDGLQHPVREKGFPSTVCFLNRELMHVGWGFSVAAALTQWVFRLSLLVMSCHQA